MAEVTIEEETEEETEEGTEEVDDPRAVLEANRKLARENKGLRRRFKDLEAKVAKVTTDSMSEQEQAIAAAVADAEKRVEAKYSERLLMSSVRAVAATLLRDPEDAVRLLDIEEDADADDLVEIERAIKALIKEKPYLAKRQGSGGNSVDQGPQGGKVPESTPGGAWLRNIAGR